MPPDDGTKGEAPPPPPEPAGGLGRRTRRSAVAALGSGGTATMLNVAATAALARLLGPDAFGLMAMALTGFAFVGPTTDFGLPHAVVHHGRDDPPLLAAMFRLNRRLTLFLLPLLVATGPLMAWFYAEPVLTWLVAGYAAALGVAMLLNLHRAVLRREMAFERLALIETGSLAAAAAAAVAVAWFGGGVAALVVLLGGQRALTGLGCWWWSGWRPLREPAATPAGELKTTLGRLKKYSTGVTVSRVVLSVSNNLDRPLIGRLAGDASLGLYQKAFEWSTTVTRAVQQPLQQVVVSAASRLRDGEEQRYRRAFRRAMARVYLASMLPSAVGVVVPAELVRLLLGPGWGGAAPIVRVLCAGAVVGSVIGPTKWLFLIEGDSRRQVIWSVGSALTGVACVLAGAWWGLARAGGGTDASAVALGVASGFAASQLLVGVPGAFYATRVSRVRLRDLLAPAAPALLAAAAAVAAAGGALGLLPPVGETFPPTLLRLGVAGGVFLAVGGAGWWLLVDRERRAAGGSGA